jgi:CheY-like chemotaxis protein
MEHTQPGLHRTTALLLHRECVSSTETLLNDTTVEINKRRILCVDDEIIGTKILGEILKKQGYEVVLCHCPFAALRCDFSIFELAILDFQMPGLNGRELLLRLRALGARFPVVLLTGCLAALSHEDRVLFARCFDKSMPIQCLLETIAEFLDPSQPPDYGT